MTVNIPRAVWETSANFITPPRNRGGVTFSFQFVCVCVCVYLSENTATEKKLHSQRCEPGMLRLKGKILTTRPSTPMVRKVWAPVVYKCLTSRSTIKVCVEMGPSKENKKVSINCCGIQQVAYYCNK